MQYRYGHDWNSFTREPVDEISEEQARRQWGSGPEFSVSRLQDGQQVPDWTLVLGPEGDYVRVTRYDAHGSVLEVWHFKRQESEQEKVFLAQLTTYVYRDDATRVQDFGESVAHKTWRFWPDGRARCRETISSEPQARVTQYRDVDVSAFWAPAPTFGDWDRWGDTPEPRTLPTPD